MIAPKFFTSNSNNLWAYDSNYCGFENGLFTSYRTSRNSKIYSNINTINDDALGDKLIKFVVPKNIKKDCLLYLKNIKISKELLFPYSSEEEKFKLICTNIMNEFKERETTVTF